MTPAVKGLFDCVVAGQDITTTEEQGQLVTRLHEAAGNLAKIIARATSASSPADEMRVIMREFRSGIEKEEDVWREYRRDDLEERALARLGRIGE